MANTLHDKVFDFLEEYRSSHPDFLYWLRERNTQNRLTDGYWFQGNLDYAFVGLYDRSGGSNRTRSIGFYFRQSGQNIECLFEIVFNEEQDERLLKLYNGIMKLFGFDGFNRLSDTRFQRPLSGTDGFAAARDFLDNTKLLIDEMIRKLKLEEIFIDKEDFNSKLQNILSIRGNTSKSLFPALKIDELKRKYEAFKDDDFFKERTRQLKFIPFAKKIISSFLKNDLNNETFTGLIQVLKNGAKSETVNYHINKNIPGINLRSELKKEFSEFEFTGYTSAGKTGITGLDSGQLEEVRRYILDCSAIKTKEEAAKRVEEFDALKIPQVKCGVYSPWLYYMNPSVFPIKNNSHDSFIEWCNQPTSSYGTAILLFHEVANILGEKDLGLIDAFTHMFSDEDDEVELETVPDNNEINIMSLNTILYGPPGTGKTYNTIPKALSIADLEFFKVNKNNRPALNNRFNELLIKDLDKLEGQIAFCSFHQSMSYEDFVEGIKPELTKEKNEGLGYSIKDGIFKIIARMAADSLEEKETKKEQKFFLAQNEISQAIFYKMSLGNTQLEGDEEIYDYCIENNCIALGWGGNIDYTGKNENEIFKAAKEAGQSDFSAQQVNMFIHYLKAGNYVVVSNGNHRFRAIGRITGDYEYRRDRPFEGYCHFREVAWLIRNVDLPVGDIYGRNFQQQTLYKLNQQEIKKEFFNPTIGERRIEQKKQPRNYVLIIDEINRGNVSQIFGELITLIEDDKRTGNTEALTVTLPYSKKTFSVPSNLYIIGTMNTADRSIEALDTALRRRFSFEQVLPDITKIDQSPDGIDLQKMLFAINSRLEALLTKDHTIGHAWLMNVYNLNDLRAAFKNKILPLLQEFFYNDYAKIGLVLGKNFVTADKVEQKLFAEFDKGGELASEYADKIIYTLKDPLGLEIEDFKSIYQKLG